MQKAQYKTSLALGTGDEGRYLFERLEAAAKKSNESVSQYCRTAIILRMVKDGMLRSADKAKVQASTAI